MDISLKQTQFIDGRYSFNFGLNKTATVIVVNESFHGNNNLGVVNRVNIFIESFSADGTKLSGNFSTSIIGVGDSFAGIMSDDTTLNGKLLTWDNLEQCVIRLYE